MRYAISRGVEAPVMRPRRPIRDDESIVSYHYHSSHYGAPDPPAKTNHEFADEDVVVTIYDQNAEKQREEDHAEKSPLMPLSDRRKDREEPSFQPFVPMISVDPSMQSKKGIDTYHERALLKTLVRHKTVKVLQVCLAIYIGVLTYAFVRDPETGLIVDPTSEERTERGVILDNGTERAVVGATRVQVICILIARMSAFFMYPGKQILHAECLIVRNSISHQNVLLVVALVLVFITKLRATGSFLAKTPVSMFMPGDLHNLHLYCGWTILIFSLVHTVFHLARWAEQGNLYLLFHHFSGISGFIIVVSLILICVPMIFCKKQMRYEIRKNLHYFFILFALALCFHTPKSAIPNGGFTAWVFGTILVWYFLDATYCLFFMTEKIETTRFEVLPNGVQMTMKVSDFFQKKGAQGGYCYVCLPWVDKTQWHAFSLFEDPVNPEERQIFVQKGGDWTNEVHRLLQRDTVRPAWVQGPFPSPYDSADAYDNHILVASGIGITPALSVIRAHKDSRRINLIWTVRDRHLLEFFLRHLYLDHDGWNLIFYTGKEELQENADIFTNTNVCIILGRPKLAKLIPNIIYGIESGWGLPEHHMAQTLAHCVEEEASIHTQVQEGISDMDSKREFEIRDIEACQKQFTLAPPRESDAILDHLDFGFKPWECHPKAHSYVKKLSQEDVMATWGIMYCGGAKVLENELKKISGTYHVGLHIESFGW
jgi:predicted ferric reductase